MSRPLCGAGWRVRARFRPFEIPVVVERRNHGACFGDFGKVDLRGDIARFLAAVRQHPAPGIDDQGMSTIRSYVIPKRLGAPTAKESPLGSGAERARYEDAAVELVDTVRDTTRSWPLLRGRTRMGREPDNHIVLDDERVSAHHALISVKDGIYFLEDLGSTNGSFTGDDDQRVMKPRPLFDGDQIRLGGVTLVFHGE